jgi:arylformamidase
LKTFALNASLVLGLASVMNCHLRDRSRAADNVEYHDNLKFAEHDMAELDLYTPRAAAAATPAVVFIHGGYWRNQSRSYYRVFTGLYQNFGLALAKRGIATAVIDYRLHPQAKLSDQLADVAAAAGFIKEKAAQYNIDPTKIFLSGHSAGGHLALMAIWAQNGSVARGAIALSPILDIAHMRESKDAEFNTTLTTPFFGSGEADMLHSPATHLKKTSRPALLLYGEKDDDYLLQQQKNYQSIFAEKQFTQAKFTTIPGADHTTIVMHVNTDKDNISDSIAAFVKTTTGEITHAK